MQISITRVIPDSPDFPFIRVDVHVHEENPDESIPLQSADFSIFIDKTDASLNEIRNLAMQKVKTFLSDALRRID